MEIYRIFNVDTGKSYIGQTTKKFKNRYWGRWYHSTHNQYLKDSVAKYGNNKFAVQILEDNVSSVEELDRLEKYYIQKYKSLCPKGYNFLDGGNSNHTLHEETKKKISLKLARSYTLIDYMGKEYNVFNLKNFCKENKLSYTSLKNMVQGQCFSSQGYGLKGTDTSLIKNPTRIYFLKNIKTGETISFQCIRCFAKKEGLNHEYLQKLLSGNRKTPYGIWSLPHMDLTRYNKMNSFLGKKLISPEGVVHTIDVTPYAFSKQHPPLDRKDIYMLITKKTKSRKGGWRLYE